MQRVSLRGLLVGLVLAAPACSSKAPARTVRVAAASDLAKAFEEIAKEFEATTQIKPIVELGSSGALAKQIERGEPYFLFASANKQFSDQVIAAGRCDGASARLYARGRIVVWTPSGVAAPVTLAELTDARFARIAIADPGHAPYGVAARQALEQAGLWSQLEDRITLGPDVQTTMLYARRHEVDAGIVALSLAVVTDGGSFLKIDPELHAPLDQQLVVCGSGEEADAARQLADFISSREGREIMTRYGFVLPGEGAR